MISEELNKLVRKNGVTYEHKLFTTDERDQNFEPMKFKHVKSNLPSVNTNDKKAHQLIKNRSGSPTIVSEV